MANSLDAFLDFVEATGFYRITKPEHVLNFATPHAYMWSRWWKNNGMPIQGGEDIRFWFVPRDSGTFEEVMPGSVTFPTNPQRLERGVVRWRYTRAHSAWNDQEILLNDKISYGSEAAMFEEFVRLRDEKYVISETAVANGLERQLSAVPDTSKMEGTTLAHTSPYSIFPFINEWINGLPYTSMTSGFPGAAWTKIEDIDPTAVNIDGQFYPNIANYSSATQDDPANLIGALDALWEQITWAQPDTLTSYQEDERLNNQQFLCTIQGKRAIMSLMRGDQDRYVAGPQDPAYPDPQFRGIPLKRWDKLETAAVYGNFAKTGLTTEGNFVTAAGNAANTANAQTYGGTVFDGVGPRIYAVNANYLYPVAHTERLMFKDKPIRHPNVPDTWAQYMATWWNLLCTSRKHQGVVAPGKAGTNVDMYVGVSAAQGSNLY
jgi:hypothetical protein